MRAPEVVTAAPATVGAALAAGAAALAGAGVEDARLNAEWLLADVLGVPRGRLRLDAGRVLSGADAARYAEHLRRRTAREPLQHIVGTQPFRAITVKTTAAAMVPRPETELLAGWALELLPPAPRRPVVIDLGTGTGCIACAIATERRDAEILAVDVSPDAAALAADNVASLGLSPRVAVTVSDLFAALSPRQVDVIVANPPYLPSAVIATLEPEVRRYDPRPALDGGADGLALLRRIVAEAPAWLVPGGALVVETAGGEQAGAVADLARAAGFTRVQTRRDLAGVERFVAGVR